MRPSSGAVLIGAACLALAGCGGSDAGPDKEAVSRPPLPGATTCYVDPHGRVGDCPVATGSSGSQVMTRAETRRQEERFDDQVARLENELDEPYGLEWSDAP